MRNLSIRKIVMKITLLTSHTTNNRALDIDYKVQILCGRFYQNKLIFHLCIVL